MGLLITLGFATILFAIMVLDLGGWGREKGGGRK